MTDSIDLGATPTISAALREALYSYLFGGLPRFDALDVIAGLTQWLDHLESSKLVPLPADPCIVVDEDGSLVLSSVGDVSKEVQKVYVTPVNVAGLLQQHLNSGDAESRAEAHWDLTQLLRGEIELPLLYDEMMIGHLLRNHGQSGPFLLSSSIDELYDLHRQFHKEDSSASAEQ